MFSKIISSFSASLKATTQSPAPVPASPAKPAPQVTVGNAQLLQHTFRADTFETAKKPSRMPNLTGASKDVMPSRQAKEIEGDGSDEQSSSSTLRVRVIPDPDGLVNFRAEPGTNGAILGTLEDGTELEVLETEWRGNTQWMRVRTPDGSEGWIVSERTAYVSGIARSAPYVQADGRDGSGSTAVDHALTRVSAEQRALLQEMYDAMPPGPNRDALGALLERTPEGNTTDTGTGYADQCLDFVNGNFGITQVADRAPQMYNPASYLRQDQLVSPPLDEAGQPIPVEDRPVLPQGQIYSDWTGTAYGAWLALENEGLVTAAEQGVDGSPILTTPLEEGTILFFGASELNNNAGHICIATGVMAPDGTPLVVTSSTAGGEVRMMSLAEVQAWTGGDYLGYTTPDQAFQEGRWGGATLD